MCKVCGARGNNHRAPHRDLPSFSKIGCFAALYLSLQLRYPCNGLQPKLRRLTLIAGNLTSLETGCILLHWYLNADHIHLQKAKVYRLHLNADCTLEVERANMLIAYNCSAQKSKVCA